MTEEKEIITIDYSWKINDWDLYKLDRDQRESFIFNHTKEAKEKLINSKEYVSLFLQPSFDEYLLSEITMERYRTNESLNITNYKIFVKYINPDFYIDEIKTVKIYI